ncbi:uncharacterized protein [Periplaneta americana]|uniref:uncharacterized protein n=1 Tax=Periplaneta americana TaxID=6978 RepID=UPI0037E8E628
MHHEAPHSRLFVHTRQAIVTRMGVSVQLCAVLVLASSCVLARPSDADVTDATSDVSRASRATSEFKVSQGYDDKQANAEHRIPVHVVFSDGDSDRPAVQFGGQHAPAQQVPVAATQNRRGDLNAAIRNEHVQNSVSSPTGSNNYENAHVRSKSNREEVWNNEDTKQQQQLDKSKTKDASKKPSSQPTDKEMILSAEEHLKQDQSSAVLEKIVGKETMATSPEKDNGGSVIANDGTTSSGRQFASPFENPILTYLTQHQPSDSNSNNLDVNIKNNENSPQNDIRREVYHQQTFINPNPYLQQFLIQQQQQSQRINPSNFQTQQPIAQQQFGSPGTQLFAYPPPSNMQPTVGYFQGQNNLQASDMNRNDMHQGNTDANSGFVTTLTLYPAIASVMYTMPTTGVSGTSIPSPSTTYPPQYPQSNPFRVVPNMPNTRLLYNGPQAFSRVSWPLADYFPIVIKDPFLSMYSMVTNMVEYGPQADVCKKAKGSRQGRSDILLDDDNDKKPEDGVPGSVFMMKGEGWRAIGKNRNPVMMGRKVPEDEKEGDSDEATGEEDRKKKDGQDTEIVMESGGNGNAGPYITRLMVRKGGVSIAGPGGIATAGSGGTAIVGPGGVAYTSPNGLAVVGPGGKVVGLPSGTDLSVIASQVTAANANGEGSTPRVFSVPPGGRVVATGPVVYYHQPE